MPLYKTTAIVLRKYNLGERDQIVNLLSPTRGKIRAVAKGVRKPTSPLAGKIELLHHLDLLVAEGRNLDIISQAVLLDGFAALRRDLERLANALYLLELLDRAVPEPEPHPELFQLLRRTLETLQTALSLPVVLRGAELQLMSLLGYAPELTRCVACSRPPEKVQRMSARLGGLLCHHCFRRDPHARSISPHGIALLDTLLRTPVDLLPTLSTHPGLLQTLTPLIRHYLLDKVGHDPRSRTFLEEVTHPLSK